ncbi:MAG: hypothetical protein ACR2IJ_10575 [Fluviibacter sp.]
MNNATLQIKIKQRLNKLASLDYDNFECWQILEAFNKAQVEWVRRQVHGNNLHKEGDESSKVLIDDLQRLLTEQNMTFENKDQFYQTQELPKDYLFFKRLDLMVGKDCCPPHRVNTFIAEQADVADLLADNYRNPSWEWGETFSVFGNNRIRVYREEDWNMDTISLMYYRTPRKVEFAGCVNLATGGTSAADVEAEFKDDVMELLIEETCLILAGDIESQLQLQKGQTTTERNN